MKWPIRMGITSSELEGLQQKVRGTSVLSLEEHLPNERGNDIPLLDTLKGEDGDLGSDVEQREIRETLVAAVESLSKQERTVIKLYYFEGQTLKEIKGVLGSFGIARLADPRASRDPSASEAARTQSGPGFSRERSDDQAEVRPAAESAPQSGAEVRR